MKNKTFIILMMLGASRLHAMSLGEVDQALRSKDFITARNRAETLRSESVAPGEIWCDATLRLAEAMSDGNDTERADALLRRFIETPGVPDSRLVLACARRIGLAKNDRAFGKLSLDFLRLHPAGPEARRVRLALVKKIELADGPVAALKILRNRPQSEKGTPDDEACRAEESRLLRLSEAPGGKNSEEARFAKAESLYKAGDYAEAEKVFAAVAGSGAPARIRIDAFLRRMESAESGNLPNAGETALHAPSGIAIETLPTRVLGTMARLRLDFAGDVANAERWATRVLESAKDPEAEPVRWVLARALARRRAGLFAVAEALRDSPVIKTCPFPPDSPLHPVSRLVTTGENGARWTEEDLGRAPPSGTPPGLRAADEYFAATRYDEAATRYAKLSRTASLSTEARAYAMLQQARSLALAERREEALAIYRKFLPSAKPPRSSYAAAALMRAGVLLAGPLHRPNHAILFYEAAFNEYPDDDDGQRAAVYRAYLLAPTNTDAAIRAANDYLKRKPDGPYASSLKELIADLKKPSASPKK